MVVHSTIYAPWHINPQAQPYQWSPIVLKKTAKGRLFLCACYFFLSYTKKSEGKLLEHLWLKRGSAETLGHGLKNAKYKKFEHTGSHTLSQNLDISILGLIILRCLAHFSLYYISSLVHSQSPFSGTQLNFKSVRWQDDSLCSCSIVEKHETAAGNGAAWRFRRCYKRTTSSPLPFFKLATRGDWG